MNFRYQGTSHFSLDDRKSVLSLRHVTVSGTSSRHTLETLTTDFKETLRNTAENHCS